MKWFKYASLLIAATLSITGHAASGSVEYKKIVGELILVDARNSIDKSKDIFGKQEFETVDGVLFKLSKNRSFKKLNIGEKTEIAFIVITYLRVFEGGKAVLLLDTLGREHAAIASRLDKVTDDNLKLQYHFDDDLVKQYRSVVAFLKQ